jgi:hypothetical protein
MEEFNAFMIAINPYGLLNWISAIYCGYVYNKIGNGVILFLALLNLVLGITIIIGG